MCARGRAPPGEGPAGAAAGGGRAAALLPLSGPRRPRPVLPAAGVFARAGYLPAIPRGGGGGRGLAPEPGPAAPGAPLVLRPALGFQLAAGGAEAPARSPRAIESGLPARALGGSAAGSVPARGDGRCGDVRGALPPAGPHGAGLCGARGVLGAPAPAGFLPRPPPPPPARRRRQDSLAPVVMVTAAPVNERLSDTRAPAQPDVAPGRAAFPLPQVLRGAGGPAQVGVRGQADPGVRELSSFLSRMVELGVENKR